MILDYVALGVLIFVGLTLFYGIIAIHDIPYEIAKRRNHPHQDAIHVAGWVSLFTLHVLWPFLWIWATLFREDRGWGFEQLKQREEELEVKEGQLERKEGELESEVGRLRAELELIRQRLSTFEDLGKED